MSAHHQEQLNAELPEDREVRLENLHRNRESGYGPQLALLEQDSVQQRMRKFHEEMSSIGTPTCSTCMEDFPAQRWCHTLPNVRGAAETGAHRNCILWPTTLTLDLYLKSYR